MNKSKRVKYLGKREMSGGEYLGELVRASLIIAQLVNKFVTEQPLTEAEQGLVIYYHEVVYERETK